MMHIDRILGNKKNKQIINLDVPEKLPIQKFSYYNKSDNITNFEELKDKGFIKIDSNKTSNININKNQTKKQNKNNSFYFDDDDYKYYANE